MIYSKKLEEILNKIKIIKLNKATQKENEAKHSERSKKR